MKGSIIKSVYARQVMGRGFPSIVAFVVTENEAVGMAGCTAGVSIGSHEIPFSYDGGTKWNGLGVMKAVKQVNDVIAPALIGLDAADQFKIDHTMLSLRTEEGERMGGNATAAVSAAALKAGAKALGIPLYRHVGGSGAVTLPCAAWGAVAGSNRYDVKHSAGAKPSYAFLAHGFDSFSEASYALWETVRKWQDFMRTKYGLSASESSPAATCAGFVYIPPNIVDNEFQLYQMLNETIASCGYEGRIGLQCDLASDCFYNRETDTYDNLYSKGSVTRDQVIENTKRMANEFNFVSIEDPLNENDYNGHAMLTKEVDIQIVGDDLFTTNINRVAEGVKVGACNNVLLKVNQIGTITEALEMIQFAYENGYGVMPCSSRGEGLDICDYSVGINAGTIRESCLGSAGSRFLEIEKELGTKAIFAGTKGIKGRRFQSKEV